MAAAAGEQARKVRGHVFIVNTNSFILGHIRHVFLIFNYTNTGDKKNSIHILRADVFAD